MSLCEVRIPTYKRPDLLRRALTSLIEQTYPNWKAIVLDDSPEQEAQQVVRELNDNRILYRPNEQNLGRSKNIDYAFYSTSYLNGMYAFVLEDDNYLLPNYIDANIRFIENNNVGIILRNQEVRLEKHGVSIPTGATTRGGWFEEGIYTPLQIYARLFFCEGISNGGLFWRTDRIKSNLQVGFRVEHSWHQEVFRTLQIKENVYFLQEPLCVFTEFYQEQNSNDFLKKFAAFKGSPEHNRGTQAILNYLVNTYNDEIVQEAQRVAIRNNAEHTLERQLISALYFKYLFKKLSYLEVMKYSFKYTLRYFLYRDPFQEILATMT
ncbi:glycosyltransferase family 2 protein [Nostoc sp. FACHB-152]|uniref:glycosyltransferase family 2 protein n=1 Tax=unclassified Nostoc TaxID=2593658 RepID=UPI001685FBBF|nr:MULTISPECIES: glycosyltransferase family 2 protein [unclassified Nostoc]MBD2445792.1 glycosyltransferase family 2 protein [Nostoc sp. FACHB-152]MBD2466906.1 glycosyltransferase family 2 protein [Nostoc sp. FACHB-145]